jgi:hypothetical protein
VTYAAVLDADVLHPYNVVDLLLRLAERRLFRPVWSELILKEVERSLVDRGLPKEKIKRRIGRMADEFPEATVSDLAQYLSSVPGEVSAKDRHVVAAALAGRADGIVTNNTRDFPAEALAQLDLEVQSLDEFLINQATLDEEAVVAVLHEIEADRQKPPRTPDELLAALQPIAPGFVALMTPLVVDR